MAYFTDVKVVGWNGFSIKDISLKFSVLPVVAENEIRWQDILFKDSDTLEHLAHDYYGDTNLHWVIMVMNGIIDPFYDLPLRSDELIEYIEMKYGVLKHDAHHYEANGLVVGSEYPGASAVSNETHELIQNELKRNIKILDPIYIPVIKENLRELLT